MVVTEEGVRSIVAAAYAVDAAEQWDGDLARLIVVLAATGGRFSQVVRLTVADVQERERRLMLPPSRKGRGTKPKHIPVPIGADVLNVLRPAIVGRQSYEPLLLRPRWRRGERGPWGVANDLRAPWASILAEGWAAPSLVPLLPLALVHRPDVEGWVADIGRAEIARSPGNSSASGNPAKRTARAPPAPIPRRGRNRPKICTPASDAVRAIKFHGQVGFRLSASSCPYLRLRRQFK